MMTSKERVWRALAFEEPDRVPFGEFAVDFEMVTHVLGRPSLFRGRFLEDQALAEGRWEELAEDYRRDYAEVVEHFGWDIVILTLMPPRNGSYKPWRQAPDGLYTHGDGRWFARSPQNWMIQMRDDSPHGDPLPPLESIVYREPALPDASCFVALDALIERFGATHFIVLRLPLGFDYPLFGLTYEESLINLLEAEAHVERWLDVERRKALALTRKLLDRCPGADAVMLSTDYAHNGGPFVAPALFRRWILPGIRSVADEVHGRGKKLIQHACGNNAALLELFIEAGIDVYQSIQFSAGMDLRLLKEQCGRRLALWGGASVESMTAGSPADVRREVLYALRHAAPGGGFILGTSHSVGVGTKPANYEALVRTLGANGHYPIGPLAAL